jgi:hypothetical protein
MRRTGINCVNLFDLTILWLVPLLYLATLLTTAEANKDPQHALDGKHSGDSSQHLRRKLNNEKVRHDRRPHPLARHTCVPTPLSFFLRYK